MSLRQRLACATLTLLPHCVTVHPAPPRDPSRHACWVRDGRPSPDQVRAARALFDQGLSFVNSSRMGEALDAFHRAQQVVDHPATSLNIARTLWMLRRYAEVVTEVEHFRTIADLARHDDLTAQAMSLLTRARQRTGTLHLRLPDRDARVYVDGVERAFPTGRVRDLALNVGRRRVDVISTGSSRVRWTLAVRPGDRHERVVDTSPSQEGRGL